MRIWVSNVYNRLESLLVWPQGGQRWAIQITLVNTQLVSQKLRLRVLWKSSAVPNLLFGSSTLPGKPPLAIVPETALPIILFLLAFMTVWIIHVIIGLWVYSLSPPPDCTPYRGHNILLGTLYPELSSVPDTQ